MGLLVLNEASLVLYFLFQCWVWSEGMIFTLLHTSSSKSLVREKEAEEEEERGRGRHNHGEDTQLYRADSSYSLVTITPDAFYIHCLLAWHSVSKRSISFLSIAVSFFSSVSSYVLYFAFTTAQISCSVTSTPPPLRDDFNHAAFLTFLPHFFIWDTTLPFFSWML